MSHTVAKLHESSFSLYRSVLGDEAWARLAPEVRRLHGGSPRVAFGELSVRRGAGWWARMLGAILRLPPAGRRPVSLEVVEEAGVEAWTRDFDGYLLASRQSVKPRQGASPMLCERFGPLALDFRLRACGGALVFVHVASHLALGGLRLRLPRWLSPRVRACASADEDDGVAICVCVDVPGVRPLLRYEGCLR